MSYLSGLQAILESSVLLNPISFPFLLLLNHILLSSSPFFGNIFFLISEFPSQLQILNIFIWITPNVSAGYGLCSLKRRYSTEDDNAWTKPICVAILTWAWVLNGAMALMPRQGMVVLFFQYNAIFLQKRQLRGYFIILLSLL